MEIDLERKIGWYFRQTSKARQDLVARVYFNSTNTSACWWRKQSLTFWFSKFFVSKMDVPNENYVPDAAQQPSQLSQVPLLPVSTSEVPILDPLPYLTTAPVSPQQDSQTTVPLFNINSVPANQPIHFSDGVLLASELQTESQPSTSNPLDQEIAIPDNLLEVTFRTSSRI